MSDRQSSETTADAVVRNGREPESLFQFQEPVSLAWAREYAERFADQKYIHVRPRELWAFVEAIERVRAFLEGEYESTKSEAEFDLCDWLVDHFKFEDTKELRRVGT